MACPRPIKKKETRVQQAKTTGAGLEVFVDWAGLIDREPVERKKCLALPSGLLHGFLSGLRP